MNIAIKTIENISYSPIFTIIAGLSSIISIVWLAYEKLLTDNSLYLPITYVIVSIILLTIVLIFTIKVRYENRALRQLGSIFHDVNKIYRNELREVFTGEPITSPKDLVKIEETVLKAVCQRIRNGMSELIGAKCMVTIKLITKDDANKKYATTYIRSLEKSNRDRDEMAEYIIATGVNTAFDQALKLRPDRPPHFYSPNLKKEKEYYNQRQRYEKHYRSTIVVPIRCKIDNDAPSTDDIGFLCIDTKSINRLNGGYHVNLMSAFSAQMYNYMSLMRGSYKVGSNDE